MKKFPGTEVCLVGASSKPSLCGQRMNALKIREFDAFATSMGAFVFECFEAAKRDGRKVVMIDPENDGERQV